MRRAAWNVATVRYCVFCALVNLAAAQTPQLCANPTNTSTGTENYARMCGVNRNAACVATVSSAFELGNTVFGPPSQAVDGVLSSAGNSGYQGAFLTNVEIAWWRVDFDITRHVQRVYIRSVFNPNLWEDMHRIIIRVGNGETVSSPLNTVCGFFATTTLDNVQTCNVLGRYLFVTRETAQNMYFTELEAFGPCTCPANQYAPPSGSACEALPCPANSYKTSTDQEPPRDGTQGCLYHIVAAFVGQNMTQVRRDL